MYFFKNNNNASNILENYIRMGIDIVVFPGNPGMWCFYRKFIDRLILKFGKHIHVHFVNYHGHGIDVKSLVKNYGYTEEQIFSCCEKKLIMNNKLHKKKNTHDINIYYNQESLDGFSQHIECSMGIFRHIVKNRIEKSDKLIVIGHSIGSYITLKVMEEFYDRIDRAYLIAPVFELIKGTSGYTKITFLMWFKIFILIAARLLYILLRILTFIPMKLALDSDTIDLCYLINPTNISNCADMALSEFLIIANNEYSRDIFKKDQENNKIQIILSRDDVWNPKNYYKRLSYDENISKNNLHMLKIDHSFVVDEISYCKVVDKIMFIETRIEQSFDYQSSDYQSLESNENNSSIDTNESTKSK